MDNCNSYVQGWSQFKWILQVSHVDVEVLSESHCWCVLLLYIVVTGVYSLSGDFCILIIVDLEVSHGDVEVLSESYCWCYVKLIPL